MPKERDFMKKWVVERLARFPDDYWLRLQDGMFGNFRPADGILFHEAIAWMLEFKLERRKGFKFSLDELPAHQKMEMEKFSNGGSRRAAAVVYHLAEKRWHVIFLGGVDGSEFE
jgi:hypothetical protein